MRFVSTFGEAPVVTFEEAVVAGFCPDGGLYIPERIPSITRETLKSWAGLSYAEVATNVLSLFVDEAEIPKSDLRTLITNAFARFTHPDVAPVVPVGELFILELFHGPTIAFKDLAMGVIVALLDYFLRRRQQRAVSRGEAPPRINIVVATSGDTGPAGAHAAIGLEQTLDYWVLFPAGMVTKEQEQQMTSVGASNVHVLKVENATSDSLDEVVKGVFEDVKFARANSLSSVNSINVARVLAQAAHFVFAYLRLCPACDKEVSFSIPTGACGDMFGGYLAREMGLPVREFIISTNSNDMLVGLFETGQMVQPRLQATLSNAIDILSPYNLWRFLYYTAAQRDPQTLRAWFDSFVASGRIDINQPGAGRRGGGAAALGHVQRGYRAASVSDAKTVETIRRYWERCEYLLDPHSAVAVAGAEAKRTRTAPGADPPMICLATAHPGKFPDVTTRAIGRVPHPQGTHASLIEQARRPQRCHLSKSERECDAQLRSLINARTASAKAAASAPAGRPSLRIVDEETLRELVTPEDALLAAHEAFSALANKSVQTPPPMAFHFKPLSGETHVKGAYLSGSSIYAVKAATSFYENPKRHKLPAGSGLVLVFDANTGFPLAVLNDNAYLTDLRTAAAGALAARHLSLPHVRKMAILGSGVQARLQLEAIRRVVRIDAVAVWSRDSSHAAQLVGEIGRTGLAATVAATVQKAVKDAELIVTVTPSETALIESPAWLGPTGVTIIAVGSDGPDKCEIHPSVLAAAGKVVTDLTRQCEVFGEVHHGVKSGLFSADRVHAELGEVVAKRKAGREGRELIVCDLTGVGVQDAAMAEVVWQRLAAKSRL